MNKRQQINIVVTSEHQRKEIKKFLLKTRAETDLKNGEILLEALENYYKKITKGQGQ